MTTGLLIDTDPALGIPFSDVDDAIAIHFCVQTGMPVDGLTTCFGNAPREKVDDVARRLGQRFEVPVFPGAAQPGQTDTAAVDALVAHTGTVLALAPMTNIAAALDRGAQWEQLIVLGGVQRRLPNLRPLHTTELNFALDLPAARTALEAADVVFPMEVCRQVFFTRHDIARLPEWLAADCAHWMRLAPFLTGRRAIHPWDLLPAMWLHSPDLFSTVRATPVLEERWGYAGAVRYEPGTAEIAVWVDAGRFTRCWSEAIAT